MTLLAYRVERGSDGFVAGWKPAPEPVAADGEVVVQVAAAALAWSDVLQSRGQYAGPVPAPPFTCGHEFAGNVIESAKGTAYSPGDSVYGFLPSPGAFAERIAVSEQYLRRMPPLLDHVAAAAVTTPLMTADIALMTVGDMTKGSSIVVHAGAGGVGRAAIQLARTYGAARVIATAGSEDRRRETVALGADAGVSYDHFGEAVGDLTEGRGADIVLESVGGAVFDASVRALAPLGRLVTIGASSGQAPERIKLPVLWQRSISICGVHLANLMRASPDILAASWSRIEPLLRDGRLDPGVGMVVAPDDLDDGVRALTARTVSGRVVIDFTRGLAAATDEPRSG